MWRAGFLERAAIPKLEYPQEPDVSNVSEIFVCTIFRLDTALGVFRVGILRIGPDWFFHFFGNWIS